MRLTVPAKLERGRVVKGPWASHPAMGFNGAFFVEHKKTILKVICSNQLGWDHVSVSTEHRCPTWREMLKIAG